MEKIKDIGITALSKAKDGAIEVIYYKNRWEKWQKNFSNLSKENTIRNNIVFIKF